MIGEKDLCAMFAELEADTLRDWVEAGLVRSARQGEALGFDDADVARVRLICELHYDLAVDRETLPLVVSLIDQIYDLRRSVRAMASALEGEPEEVRLRISAAFRRRLSF
jgi:chaperone modulatory protein CbpM